MSVLDKHGTEPRATLEKRKQLARVISSSIRYLQQIALLSKRTENLPHRKSWLSPQPSGAEQYGLIKMSSDLSCKHQYLWAFSEFRKVEVGRLHATLGSSSRAWLVFKEMSLQESEAEAVLGWPGPRKGGMSWRKAWRHFGSLQGTIERASDTASVSEGSRPEDRIHARNLVQGTSVIENLKGQPGDREASQRSAVVGSR